MRKQKSKAPEVGESLLPIFHTDRCGSQYPVSMPWKAGESLLRGKRQGEEEVVRLVVSMPWKAGESLLQQDWAGETVFCNPRLNALESGRVIVTYVGESERKIKEARLNALESGRVIVTCKGGAGIYPQDSCLNALESGRVIVTDPILEAGGSRAREPRIANLPS
jgi:hypothetical protein